MTNFALLKDITGQRFHRLFVLELNGRYKNGNAIWKCVCDCGNEVNVVGQKMRSGHTKSCGCLARELVAKRRIKHGESRTRLFRIWGGMLNRCSNPKNANWKNYGGRGVKVCLSWAEGFAEFRDWSIANGYAENLSIDRMNNDGDYEPLNCRWTSRVEQAANKRNNVKLSDGRLAYKASAVCNSQTRKRIVLGMTVDEAALTPRMRKKHLLPDGSLGLHLAKANGISAKTFTMRVCSLGWTPEKAATTPVRKVR